MIESKSSNNNLLKSNNNNRKKSIRIIRMNKSSDFLYFIFV